MGYVRTRYKDDGTVRYTAYYRDLKGRQRSAGTFGAKRQATRAWKQAESQIAEGRAGDPARGRMTFRRYVHEVWLPNHHVEATTRQSYVSSLNNHILDEFGAMRMVDILPEHVRAWVTRLRDKGMSAATIKNNKALLSVIFTTALNDQVIYIHPCKGVKTPTVAVKPRTIITPTQFDTVYASLMDADSRLLAETAIESGMRWGELTELRVHDLDPRTHLVTVSRAVVELSPQHHPTGGRFLVKDYPKDKEYRRFQLSPQIVAKLTDHINQHSLNGEDLLFSLTATPPAAERPAPDPTTLGFTAPTPQGRQYRHGTLSAYSAGKCRCPHCRNAYATYRAERRKRGHDNPRTPRTRDTDGHIPADWYRVQRWHPALNTAGLPHKVRFHDLRHAHASWLLAGGADLQVVKERLGHASIATTERYLHTLPNADTTALNALNTIRQPR